MNCETVRTPTHPGSVRTSLVVITEVYAVGVVCGTPLDGRMVEWETFDNPLPGQSDGPQLPTHHRLVDYLESQNAD